MKKETTVEAATTFSRELLLKAETFANRRDALCALVKEGELVTIKEAEARINAFMKGKVR